MNKRGLSLTSVIILMLALTIGSAVTMGNLSIGETELLKGNISKGFENITFNATFTETGLAPDLEQAAEFYLTGLFRAYEHIIYWIIDYTVRHPDVPYKLILYLLILAILAPLIILALKLIIIIFLLIKEYFQNRKEKRELQCQKQRLVSK